LQVVDTQKILTVFDQITIPVFIFLQGSADRARFGR
jgi:hypothetical protein